MAFSSTVTKVYPVAVGARRAIGTFTNAATDSGGTISTGLKYVRSFSASFSSHVGTETLKHTLNSANAGQVVIVTSEGADGVWSAEGL